MIKLNKRNLEELLDYLHKCTLLSGINSVEVFSDEYSDGIYYRAVRYELTPIGEPRPLFRQYIDQEVAKDMQPLYDVFK